MDAMGSAGLTTTGPAIGTCALRSTLFSQLMSCEVMDTGRIAHPPHSETVVSVSEGTTKNVCSLLVLASAASAKKNGATYPPAIWTLGSFGSRKGGATWLAHGSRLKLLTLSRIGSVCSPGFC